MFQEIYTNNLYIRNILWLFFPKFAKSRKENGAFKDRLKRNLLVPVGIAKAIGLVRILP